MTAVIHKGMDESNARFDRIFKEMTDHKDGTAQMSQALERVATLESEMAEQDWKVTASEFLDELESMKQHALDAYAAATKVNINADDDTPSHERVESAPHDLNTDGKPKLLFPFASIDKPMSAWSKWELEMVPYPNCKELSTHLMTFKINGDAIQEMKMSHWQASILFFDATNF